MCEGERGLLMRHKHHQHSVFMLPVEEWLRSREQAFLNASLRTERSCFHCHFVFVNLTDQVPKLGRWPVRLPGCAQVRRWAGLQSLWMFYPRSSSWICFPNGTNASVWPSIFWTVWDEVDLPLGWASTWKSGHVTDQVGNSFLLFETLFFLPNAHFCVFAAGRCSALWCIYWWIDRLIDTKTNCWFLYGLVRVLLFISCHY